MKYLLLVLFLVGCTTTQKVAEVRSQYFVADQLHCMEVTKMYSKRQLSELTKEEKFLVNGAKECGAVYLNVRMRKDRVRGYSSHYSIELWRDSKDDDDPGAPLHVTKVNVEYCQVLLGGPDQEKSNPVLLGMTCKELDEVLK